MLRYDFALLVIEDAMGFFHHTLGLEPLGCNTLLVKYFLTALALEALNRASNDSEPTPVTWEAIRTCLICFTRFSPRATSSRTCRLGGQPICESFKRDGL